MNTPDPSPPAASETELPWHPITELETERSLKDSERGNRARREQSADADMEEALGAVKELIVSIFTACIDLGLAQSRFFFSISISED